MAGRTKEKFLRWSWSRNQEKFFNCIIRISSLVSCISSKYDIRDTKYGSLFCLLQFAFLDLLHLAGDFGRGLLANDDRLDPFVELLGDQRVLGIRPNGGVRREIHNAGKLRKDRGNRSQGFPVRRQVPGLAGQKRLLLFLRKPFQKEI